MTTRKENERKLINHNGPCTVDHCVGCVTNMNESCNSYCDQKHQTRSYSKGYG